MGERIVYVPITEHYTHMIPVDLDERWDDDETPTWEEILDYVACSDPAERLPFIGRPRADWETSLADAWAGAACDLYPWGYYDLALSTADSRRWLAERVLIALGCRLESTDG